MKEVNTFLEELFSPGKTSKLKHVTFCASTVYSSFKDQQSRSVVNSS